MKVNKGTNPYCGPAVISILTGKNTDEAARQLALAWNVPQSAIRGVPIQVILATIGKCGGRTESRDACKDSSLFLAAHYIHAQNGKYLFWLDGTTSRSHVVAVEVKDHKVFYCDNRTGESVPIEACVLGMSKVTGCWYIEIEEPYELACPHGDRYYAEFCRSEMFL